MQFYLLNVVTGQIMAKGDSAPLLDEYARHHIKGDYLRIQHVKDLEPLTDEQYSLLLNHIYGTDVYSATNLPDRTNPDVETSIYTQIDSLSVPVINTQQEGEQMTPPTAAPLPGPQPGPVAQNVPAPVMVYPEPKEGHYTYDQYVQAGWTDEQLRTNNNGELAYLIPYKKFPEQQPPAPPQGPPAPPQGPPAPPQQVSPPGVAPAADPNAQAPPRVPGEQPQIPPQIPGSAPVPGGAPVPTPGGASAQLPGDVVDFDVKAWYRELADMFKAKGQKNIVKKNVTLGAFTVKPAKGNVWLIEVKHEDAQYINFLTNCDPNLEFTDLKNHRRIKNLTKDKVDELLKYYINALQG